MRADYPLLLEPHLASRVWGGDRLGPGIGEAWDLSVHANGPSRIRNGPLRGRTLAEVSEERPEDFGGPIALLAKRLDCKETLSVQVHPTEGESKTECWVVLEASPGAGVYHGFLEGFRAAEARRAAQDGSLPDRLRFLPAKPRDSVFVPSGTVHAIGGGLFLFELQQSSDVTYRLYDWGRGRALHLEQGLACSDFDQREPAQEPRRLGDGALRLVSCEHFFVDRIETEDPVVLDPAGRWVALFLLEGEAEVGGWPLAPGETLLLPHAAGAASLSPKGRVHALRYGPSGAGSHPPETP